MKRTQAIDLLSTIRESIVSFLAITVFIASGVAVFLGIHWSGNALYSMATRQLVAGNAHDVEVIFPYGLTREDVSAIAGLAKDDDLVVESGAFCVQPMMYRGRKYSMRVGTLPQTIDAFISVEGTLPEDKDQIAVEATWASRHEVTIGSVLTGGEGSGVFDSLPYLRSKSFKVTALVESPAYLGSSSSTYGVGVSVNCLGWVTPEAFNKALELGGSSYVLVRSKQLAKLPPFSKGYQEGCIKLEEEVTNLGKELSAARIEALRKLGEQLQGLETKTVVSALNTYKEYESRKESGKITQQEEDLALDMLGVTLQARLAQKGIQTKALDHNNLAPMLKTLELSLEDVDAKTVETVLPAMQQRLTNMPDLSWTVLTRSYNGALLLLEGFVGVTSNLRWSMASLFLVVGVLVCYSALSRLVHEQVTRIGTKKALGFRAREVNRLFFCYSGLCVALGLILGVILAVNLVEHLLIRTLGNRFIVPTNLYVNVVDVGFMGILQVVLILGATWLAVRGVLRRHAVELLAGETPPTAKPRFYEHWGIWKRMGLLAQTTINNCINDKRRVVGTLIGVAGCTALVVCAIMLRENVMDSFSRQYETICHYDAVGTVSAKGADQGIKLLTDASMRATPVTMNSYVLERPDGGLDAANVVVPHDWESFSALYVMHPVYSQGDVSKGVWVSQAYHEHMGANVGDTLTITNGMGISYSLPIAGFFEWHLLSNQVVVSSDVYKDIFGSDALVNKLLIDTNGKGYEEAAVVLKGSDGFEGVSDDYTANKSGFNEFASIANIVVAVYLALAIAMAACVLLNLDVMFVNEKKRELIVLMICGYSLKDARGYIWHDSVALTALGILCGVLMGSVAGGATIRSIEWANASFLHGVSWMATACGVAGTTVLATLALLVALRHIRGFDLTDINRF